jgi:hypothetical protein
MINLLNEAVEITKKALNNNNVIINPIEDQDKVINFLNFIYEKLVDLNEKESTKNDYNKIFQSSVLKATIGIIKYSATKILSDSINDPKKFIEYIDSIYNNQVELEKKELKRLESNGEFDPLW